MKTIFIILVITLFTSQFTFAQSDCTFLYVYKGQLDSDQPVILGFPTTHFLMNNSTDHTPYKFYKVESNIEIQERSHLSSHLCGGVIDKVFKRDSINLVILIKRTDNIEELQVPIRDINFYFEDYKQLKRLVIELPKVTIQQ